MVALATGNISQAGTDNKQKNRRLAWARTAQSVLRLATGWTVGVEIFRTRPDRPWGPPSLLYHGYRVFPTVKAAGAWR
jgi:hypothetical protein